MDARVTAFVARRWRVPAAAIRVEIQPLPGGLESAVALARINHGSRRDTIPGRLVVKELRSGFEREADIYELLWHHLEQPPVVRLLGREQSERATYLYLEDARPVSAWPWANTERAAIVCRELARFHDSQGLPRDRFSWNYETELARSAAATQELAETARDATGRRHWRRLGDLKRIVAALAAIRVRLLSGVTTVIHGDMHPGNVVLRPGHPDGEVVLLDWARARIGSPLEDVAAWLHSLGCWEPQARRRHDTLMRVYLAGRTAPRPFAADVRFDYWLASASNGLAGAIRYHLFVVSNPASTKSARHHSRLALAAWQRVVRRAAALVRTNLDRRR